MFRHTLLICFILILSLFFLVSCGDDPVDEWVGMWKVETSDGKKLNEVMNEEFFKIWDDFGIPRSFITRLQVEGDYYFGDDGRWQSILTFDARFSGEIIDKLPSRARRIPDQVETGSYIVTDDRFTMVGDRGNTSVIGNYSGVWRRHGNKLTLIYDDSYMSNIILTAVNRK